MADLATAEIQNVYRMYQAVRRMENPPSEALELLEQAQDIIKNESRVDLAFMTASEKQISLANGFWDDLYDVIAFVGANRSGKSWGAAVLCLSRWIRGRAEPGSRVWCVSQNSKSSISGAQRELWEALPQDGFSRPWNPESGFGNRGIVQYRCTNSKKGYCTLTFLNEEQDVNVFESVPCDMVWWDEASKESLFGRLLMRVLDKSGVILISTIPEEIWLQLRINESDNPRWVFRQFSTFDNERNLPEGKIKQLAQGLTPEEYRMRVLGEFVSMTGLAFPEYLNRLQPDGHNIEPPAKIPKDNAGLSPRFDLFIDPGVHTAALLLAVMPDNSLVVWDEVYCVGERPDAIVGRIRDMLERWKLSMEDLGDIAMDPAGWNTTPSNELNLRDEYDKYGLRARKWILTRAYGGGEKAMIARVRVRLQERTLFINDCCTNTIREMRMWRWVMDDTQRIDIKEKLANTDNHACDALKAWVCDDPRYTTFIRAVYDMDPDFAEMQDENAWQEALV